MLHPTLLADEALSEWRARWRAERCLRIAPFLREDIAEALLTALRPQAFTLIATISATLSFQYFSFTLKPEDSCDHVLCHFGRWLWTDGAEWLSALTDMPLGPPDDRLLQSSLYTKGCYLDVHNDYDGTRQIAFIIGLTRTLTGGDAPVHSADIGGQLEFLRAAPEGAELVERRPAGWNTLDIFDVRAPDRLHRVPVVTRALERRAISGWLYQRSE